MVPHLGARHGHGSGQNLGLTEFEQGYFGDGWYTNWAVDLLYYSGYSGSGKVANAPEECTWLGKLPPGPCGGGDGEWEGAVYGVPANLLRFILDLYGPGYSGGETALMRELTGSDQTGYSNLTTVTGDSIGLLLTLFGLNLWADGRIWHS